VDEKVVEELEKDYILVINETKFSPKKLSPIVDELLSNTQVNLDYKELAYEFAMERREEFIQ